MKKVILISKNTIYKEICATHKYLFHKCHDHDNLTQKISISLYIVYLLEQCMTFMLITIHVNPTLLSIVKQHLQMMRSIVLDSVLFI